MKRFQKAILAVALATLFILLWKIHPGEVWSYLALVGGWGMGLILVQEIVAHVFNALGWRYAFTATGSRSYAFLELLKLRVIGDGVNYLTPSATIAGEVIRAVSLNESQGSGIRYASVAVAKFTQSLAQMLFILLGLLFIIAGSNPIAQTYPRIIYGFSVAIAITLVLLVVGGAWMWKSMAARSAPRPDDADIMPASWMATLGEIPRQCLGFAVRHTGRFALSIAWFMLGYAWGAFEGYWICVFLGVPVSVKTALIIEILSNFIDGVLFMVPAKIGTQEGGKTAIFAGLGLPAGAGFAFGVVRHIRELIWSSAGLLLGYLHKNRKPHV